jgi:hypothetical protein
VRAVHVPFLVDIVGRRPSREPKSGCERALERLGEDAIRGPVDGLEEPRARRPAREEDRGVSAVPGRPDGVFFAEESLEVASRERGVIGTDRRGLRMGAELPVERPPQPLSEVAVSLILDPPRRPERLRPERIPGLVGCHDRNGAGRAA